MIRAFFAAALLFTGCADGTVAPPPPSHPASPAAQPGASPPDHSTAAAVPEEHHDHEHGATYACPMHPDVVSDKPGQCPKCGMNLVVQPRASASGSIPGHSKD